MNARGLDVICVALLLAAIPSVYADQTENAGLSAPMEQRVGSSRPGIGAGPYRSGISLRRLPDDPAPCGPKQIHLFVNRPCVGKTGVQNNGGGEHDKGNGGPVIVLGGSPYNLGDNGPSGDNDDPHNHNGNPPIPDGPNLPGHFAQTPEPGYMAITGLAFAAVWVLARKRCVRLT